MSSSQPLFSSSTVQGLEAISHQGRTALATLRGYVEILEEELAERGIHMPDEFGHMERALAALLDTIGRLEAHAARAGHEAAVDVLTGLPNRRSLFEIGRGLMEENRDLTAILLDLDDFKWVNDAFGHHAGDQVLVELARRLREVLRSGDRVCRLAGDEFVVLLPGANREAGCRIARRICAAVAATPFEVEGATLWLTASTGVASRTGEHRDLDALLREADREMYARKRSRCRAAKRRVSARAERP